MSDLAMRTGEWIDERFEIERLVGSGGMGRVYRARDHHSGQSVAVKFLAQPDKRATARFLHESLVLAEIQHPGIVRYVAHGTTPTGEPYLAMEWLEGQDLAHYLGRLRREIAAQTPQAELEQSIPMTTTTAQSTMHLGTLELATSTVDDPVAQRANPAAQGPHLPIPDVIQLGRRLTSAVAELHRRGIVHRDIKPGNLFLRGGSLEQVKLLDFGTVRRPLAHERMTEPGRLIGTPHYMAPEQARSGSEVGPATDIWAIGCVLYECLTGTKAFAGNDLLAVLTSILLNEPIPIRLLRPEVPQPLAELITRMLIKLPANRPDDAGALSDALGAIRTTGPQSVVSADDNLNDTIPAPISLTATEARVTCMLFASDGQMGETGDMSLPADDRPLSAAVAATGAELQRLANGTLLVTIPDPRLPTDQASRAARAAMALRQVAPGLAMVLATGRAEGPRQIPLEQVVRQAAPALERLGAGRIRVDALTASLLDPRFHISRESDGIYLESERQHEAT
ncbi:MAG TPA: serine/threonine-protein kinase, partial [Haliangium sp.]|nr:serine/threonine-protein kinase [Haliangium sp.]